jgi:hypothetical protein
MLSTSANGSAVLHRGWWISLAMALTVLVTGGALATGTSASAASSALEGAATPQAAACREVIASSVPVYRSSTGSAIHGHFYYGDIFTHHGLVNNRWRTWWPPGVPESQGRTAYVQNSGTVGVRCPW